MNQVPHQNDQQPLEPTIYKKSVQGRIGYSLPQYSEIKKDYLASLDPQLLRDKKARLPEVSELDVVRHYTRLSRYNYAIDTQFYPLGSCTMKYNPRINEEVAANPDWLNMHPHLPDEKVQGCLELIYTLNRYLCEITGMDDLSLQPAAGAHAEFTGLLMIKAYHTSKGKPRKKVLIPDSAHGTNPASAKICGYDVVTIKTGADGILDPKEVIPLIDDDVACLMVTNPSTIGLFEESIAQIASVLHDHGAFLYCDGANMNALVGSARVGDMGVDCLHLNLHKTFTTPHGGGGPGCGPILVKNSLVDFLPKPVISKKQDFYFRDFNRPLSVGQVRAFYGNFGMMVRALTYILEMGASGLKKVSEFAVLNANYLRAKLQDKLSLAYEQTSMHEVIFSDKFLKEIKNQWADTNQKPLKTLDVAKRLIDYGFHPPTIYFPLIVSGALMIEPTETESKQTLDQFVAAFEKILNEAVENPELIRQAPHNSPLARLDEVQAVKQPVLREVF